MANNSEVTDITNWLDGGTKQEKRVGRALRQTTRRSELDDFSFSGIEAQSVAGHPGFDSGDAVRHLIQQLGGLSRVDMLVDLKVISLGMSRKTALLDETDDTKGTARVQGHSPEVRHTPWA